MNNLILSIAIFAISFLTVSGCSDGGGSENLTNEQKALIDNIVDCVRLEKQLPGVAMSILKNGKVIYEKGYGKADIGTDTEITSDTLFAIGSVTKIFTTFAVMQLIEDGHASLDDQVGTYLTDLPNESWKIVTIRDLLSMSSGIPEYSFCRGGAKDGQACQDNNQFPIFNPCGEDSVCVSANRVPYPEYLDGAAAEPIQFPGGDQYYYSNTNFVILGLLIEALSGAPYETYLENNVLAPMGMTSTFPNNVPPPAIQGLATGYRITTNPGPDAVPCVTFENPPDNCSQPEPEGVMCEAVPVDELRLPEQSFSAGWLVSNLSDFDKLEKFLHDLSPELLQSESYAEMWTNRQLNNGSYEVFGLGWGVCSELDEGACPRHIDPLSGGDTPDDNTVENPAIIGKVVAKDGALAGYASYIARYLEDGLTIVVFINVVNPQEPPALKFGPLALIAPVADVVRGNN